MAKADTDRTGRRLYLVDGSGYIFRAYHALPAMTSADGTPVNAVYGFCNMLLKLLDDAEADAMAVIFDACRRSFRNDIYPEYKAHRPEAPEDLVPQFALIREATRAFGQPSIELEGYEADDLIATYARLAHEAGWRVVIVSSDKDLMQLVRPGVEMLDPMKNIRVGEDGVRDKFGVGPDKVIDVQALAGDSVDNVPGVPGIGIKTAAQLINDYGDLDALLARAEEIKQPKRRQNLIEFAEQARISRELVTLKSDVAVAATLDEFDMAEADRDALSAFLEQQGFKSLLARLRARWGQGAAGAEAAASSEAVYELVQDVGALQSWIERATAAGLVAIDTETTSLNAMRADLVGVSLATAAGRACYVPLGHVGATPEGALDFDDGAGDVGEQIPIAAALSLLRPLLEDPSVLKVGHNMKYDLLVLCEAFARALPDQAPLTAAAVDDTMLLSYVLDAGRHGHGLDELAGAHLGHHMIKFRDVVGSGKTQITFAQVALDEARDYAAEDADFTWRLHRLLKPRLVADHMASMYEIIERPLVPAIVSMERAGIMVDRAALDRLGQTFAARRQVLEEEAQQLAGTPFNVGSPKQLGEILFDSMGLPGGRKGKTGAYATGADVLEDLAAQGHELPRKVLDWRLVSKLKSTYTDALVGQINARTGRVHTAYGMAIAQTGRLSSNDPNLQNIPVRTEEGRQIRAAFIAPSGCKLVSLDYSQIELRIVAHAANVETLVAAFAAGDDIHALTASQVFQVPVDTLDPLLRRRAKAINFGIIYGISPFGLARNLGIERGEAKAYIDAYFERYPGIRDYMEQMRRAARADGMVRTLFGRKIHLAGIGDKNPAVRSFAERQAINAPIQGTAADIIKRAMIRVPPALARAGLGARMLLQVHDELLFEVPDGEVDETVETVRAVMETAPMPALELRVPLVADAGVGDNWAQAH